MRKLRFEEVEAQVIQPIISRIWTNTHIPFFFFNLNFLFVNVYVWLI